ncbi:magnesium transporter CorA family protein [Niallia nealsonii]|uniref:Mg2+ transporter protein, CorA-like protein n=1 Tax=Niallia nealsonii TaxID=115979 RepID=A0A2N0YW43_9BACI|nr:magnesium transporter CorA family protein [Niallia nealsonii]PKG21502.1 Mg2+ transporter protein, CorA-like protein [Niallia nealsonii]
MQKYHMNEWVWYQLKEQEGLQEIHTNYDQEIKRWSQIIKNKTRNFLQINTENEGREIISGSLIYHREVDNKDSYELFHFFLTKDILITLDYKDNSLHLNNHIDIHKEIKRGTSPVEGFMVILGSIMTEILYRIDSYEERLDKLIWDIKEKNSIKTLEKVFQSRHEIIVWKNVMIPFLELRYAIEETFGEDTLNGREYKRISKRIERGLTLVEEYQKELNNLVHFEEVVSQHRGNEIMKTLTVLTTLCTPIMAWGALWGMNFKLMPELDWKLGYPFSLSVIAVSSIIVYFYLRSKGWMGDLLKAKKRNSFFR